MRAAAIALLLFVISVNAIGAVGLVVSRGTAYVVEEGIDASRMRHLVDAWMGDRRSPVASQESENTRGRAHTQNRSSVSRGEECRGPFCSFRRGDTLWAAVTFWVVSCFMMAVAAGTRRYRFVRWLLWGALVTMGVADGFVWGWTEYSWLYAGVVLVKTGAILWALAWLRSPQLNVDQSHA